MLENTGSKLKDLKMARFSFFYILPYSHFKNECNED